MFARLAIRCAAVVALAVGGLMPAASYAQQELDRIAAVVNDDIISLQELEGRMKIALLFSNLPDSMENRRRIAPQLIRKMIDERLQMQEANRLKISLSAAEVEGGIAMIEQNNRMPKGALLNTLTKAGVDVTLMHEQIKADLTWMRLTSRVLIGQVKVGEEEITDRLDSIRDRQGKPEYLVQEIYLPVDNPSQEDEVRRLGERLVEQLRAGAPFQALAGQFSRSPTAANGGNMGWVVESNLDEDLTKALMSLTKGSDSPLLRAPSGYYILHLQDQRIAGQTVNVDDSVVKLAKMTLPVPANAPPRQELLAKAAEMTRTLRNCDDMDALSRKAGASVVRQGPLKLGELPSGQRRSLSNLPVNRAAEPQDGADGITVTMLCSREDATQFSMPTREQVRRTLEDERMDMLSRRYIRDLRRAAFIEIRG